ncbi:Hypothetical_protein [Hexamita inflata]|uniref:Hypothetical_protein n=1 Tax=Hexamita inflata TaxID=28002 RepID=A0ABP1HV79_9EUKA
MWFGLLVWCRASCSTMSCLRFTRDSLKLSARSSAVFSRAFPALQASARVLRCSDQNLLAASFDQRTWSFERFFIQLPQLLSSWPSCSWNCARSCQRVLG